MNSSGQISIETISHDARYHGWPTVARRNNGELLCAYSGGREAHVCPFGQVHLVRSSDEGRTWSGPAVLADGPLDDRDAGVLETSRGTLLVNWFTSLAWESMLERAERAEPRPGKEREQQFAQDEARVARWKKVRDALTDDVRRRELGCWVIRSEDGGTTWSDKIDTLVNSPHGPTELAEGRLLYVGTLRRETREPSEGGSPFCGRLCVAESNDDARSWKRIAEIAAAPGDTAAQYHEPHAVEAADGRIVAQIRNHNENHHHETLQTESFDGGKTWAVPHGIGVWGYPSHLLRLRDTRLLMTYGHRRPPMGNLARLSDDHGRSWSDPISLSADGAGDLGYPSSVQLDEKALLTVWYERRPDAPMAVLRQARWNLDNSD